MAIKRTSFWLHSDNDLELFAWLHQPVSFYKSKAILIISPIGPESMHCYRSIRCLADNLAKQGLLVARYDHPGMGNSTGNLENKLNWDDLLTAPQKVIDYLCDELGVDSVSVICLRSASLVFDSCLSSSKVDEIIYWYPYVRGAAFVRDMQSLDSMLNMQSNDADGILNGGGYPLNQYSQQALSRINLSKSKFKYFRRALLIENIELPSNTHFFDNLIQQNIVADKVELDGFSKMVRRAILSEIPFSNIEYITNWLKRSIRDNEKLSSDIKSAKKLAVNSYTEQVVSIPSIKPMHGILTAQNNKKGLADSTLIVFSNAGVAHNIGPNRIYVDASRSLVLEGISSLRFDLSNIGDSIDEYSSDNHHPYPNSAAQEINAAVDFMRAEYGFKKVILSGLSSGAHNCYHAALDKSSSINGLILINPMTFYWKPGQSLFAPEEHKNEMDAAYYQDKMYDSKKWLRLLLSPKKILSVTGFVSRMILSKVSSSFGVLLKKMGLAKLNYFESDVDYLFKKGVSVSIIYSESDPGFNILMSQAKLVVKQGIKKGLFHSMLIKSADHTFSSFESRKRLFKCMDSSIRLIK